MPPKKLLFVFFIFFILLSLISFIRLVRITINTSTNPTTTSHTEDSLLTPKEHRLLLDLIARKAPCNLIFFGVNQEFLSLSELNTEGTTIFLEDDVEKLRRATPRGAQIHKVKYHEKAGKAFELLKHGRSHPGCRPDAGPLHESSCKLALTGLPHEVYQKKWDVVVVDGPRGDQAEAPGRMGAIYTAAMIARAGNTTDVVVHDVDRMIEKWYSWEFLCHENWISSKGKFWHFRINGYSSSAGFCQESTIQIV